MTQYHSKPVSEHGHIDWDQDEHAVWHELITRQQEVVKTRACQAYLDGLNMLNLPTDRPATIAGNKPSIAKRNRLAS